MPGVSESLRAALRPLHRVHQRAAIISQLALFDTTADAEPTRFALWKREPVKGARWRIVGRADTMLEAVGLMQGSGEYRIEERPGPTAPHSHPDS